MKGLRVAINTSQQIARRYSLQPATAPVMDRIEDLPKSAAKPVRSTIINYDVHTCQKTVTISQPDFNFLIESLAQDLTSPRTKTEESTTIATMFSEGQIQPQLMHFMNSLNQEDLNRQSAPINYSNNTSTESESNKSVRPDLLYLIESCQGFPL